MTDDEYFNDPRLEEIRVSARRAALLEAAEEVHTEARWTMLQTARNLTPGRLGDPVDRLLLIERILRDRAAALGTTP